METGKIAWTTLATGVVAYDVWAGYQDNHQTLTETAHEALDKHPIITLSAIGATALHLAGAFQKYDLERYDPIHRLAGLVGAKNEDK